MSGLPSSMARFVFNHDSHTRIANPQLPFAQFIAAELDLKVRYLNPDYSPDYQSGREATDRLLALARENPARMYAVYAEIIDTNLDGGRLGALEMLDTMMAPGVDTKAVIPGIVRSLSDVTPEIRGAATRLLTLLDSSVKAWKASDDFGPYEAKSDPFILSDRRLLESLCAALEQDEEELRRVASIFFQSNPHILQSAIPFLSQLVAANRNAPL